MAHRSLAHHVALRVQDGTEPRRVPPLYLARATSTGCQGHAFRVRLGGRTRDTSGRASGGGAPRTTTRRRLARIPTTTLRKRRSFSAYYLLDRFICLPRPVGFVLDPPPRRRPALPTETTCAAAELARERAACFALICGVMLKQPRERSRWFVQVLYEFDRVRRGHVPRVPRAWAQVPSARWRPCRAVRSERCRMHSQRNLLRRAALEGHWSSRTCSVMAYRREGSLEERERDDPLVHGARRHIDTHACTY